MANYLGKKIKFNIEDNDLQKIRFNKAYGESQQATRSGKNFLENTGVSNTSNGVTFTINDDKTILVDGNNDGTANSKFIINNYSLKAGTYILNGCPSGGSSTTYRLAIQKTSDWSILGLDTGSGSEQFTIDEATNIQVAIFIQKGQTISNLLFKPMLRKATIADDTYEQYGAMPSPDYRSEIENIEGRNILQNKQKTQTINGVTFTVNKDKSVSIKGTVTADASFYFYTSSNYLMLKKGTYTLSGVNGGSSTSYKMLIYKTDWTFIGQDIGNGLTFTLEEDANVFIYIWVKNGITVNTTVYPQLEGGTVATPYVPYNSLEFKDEGKNKFNVQDTNSVTEGITVDNEGWITVTGDNTDGTATKFFNYFTNNLALKTVTNYNVIAEVKSVNGTGIVHFASNGSTSKQFETRFYRDFTNLANNKVYKLICKTADEFVGNKGLRTFVEFSAGQSGSITFRLSVLEDTTITPENFEYEPYKSQVAYFPLAEGQKLYKGSYLADDGTHHKRKQVVLDGTENWALTSTDNQVLTKRFSANIISDMKVGSANTALSTHFSVTENATEDKESIYFAVLGTVTYIALRISVDKATTVEQLKIYLATEYANGTPVIVEYELAEEEIVPYTDDQKEAWEKLRHFKGLNGENNITAQGTMTSTLDLTLYNVAEEDFDIYISKKGYFGALKYDINNLIDFMESNIPSIAEATESSVKIAGRDGDISLNTVYEPLPFEIVCYTEDNLTPEEKIIEEQKITSLLNSIKNQTKTFFMEREKKFYKVKYSGNLSVVRYPKHLKFTIPLKSSESYAMNFEESEIIGNGTKVSNTIKDTGAIFTIKGPATKPIISLNNYQMKYNENILEGNSLIINSEDSTITHITSAGVKTNAMRAYNHEFPKIKNGENQLAVSSGIDDEKQVNVKWYDLKI